MTDQDHDDPSTVSDGDADSWWSRPKSSADIAADYAEVVGCIDRWGWLEEALVGRFRRRHFASAEGRVLDVACGTGTNIPHLPAAVDYTGIDVSPEMLARAKERLGRFAGDVAIRRMDAQELAFPDDHFDTVVSALSTCTFPDPVAVLNEMGRVCKPDGRILLLEHGRGDNRVVARLLDWGSDAHYANVGCRWNQEPLAVVQASDLELSNADRSVFGVLSEIEATPS